MKNWILITLLLFGSVNLEASTNKERMLRDLDIIKSTFETKYAPFEWKKEYAGWSLDEEIDIAKAKIEIANDLTVHDYQKILHSFFMSTCDYHVCNRYYSTETALLPFSVKSADGRYFISAVESHLKVMLELGLFRGSQLPSVGDEILIFDSRPIDEVIQRLKLDELGNHLSKTAQVLAEDILTKRFRSLGHDVPHGTVEIHFKNKSGEIIVGEMDWVYAPELIANKNVSFLLFASATKSSDPIATPLNLFSSSNKAFTSRDLLVNVSENNHEEISERYKTKAVNPVAEALHADTTKIYRKFFAQTIQSQSEAKEPEKASAGQSLERGLLTLGFKIWQEATPSPFKAYIYRTSQQKKIGYIRLNTYGPSGNYTNVSNQATQLANILRFFEVNTDALVIDQVDNPGGYLLYAYAIIAMLTDKPLIGLPCQFTITQEDVSQAFNEIESITSDLQNGIGVHLILGYPATEEFFLNRLAYNEFIISEWEAGRTLTNKIPAEGLHNIQPHVQASYSKPIIMLVDSRDFSCADIVPAMLQDNKRALIFGEQTAGAGGIVKQHSYPNLFGLEHFSYTASIFERLDGSRIENLGVTPDFPYAVTQEDLLNGYRGYTNAVNQAVESVLK